MNDSVRYDSRKCSPEHAVSLIKDGDAILVAGDPGALLEALARNGAKRKDLRLYTLFGLSGNAGAAWYASEAAAVSCVTAVLPGENERKAGPGHGIDQAPVHLSAAEQYLADCRPTVLLAQCPPPGDDGCFYLDAGACAALERGVKVIIQVDLNMPLIYSDCSRLPLSRVDALCEAASPPVPADTCGVSPGAQDRAIAGFVAEQIPDGAAIQLGPGFLPDLAGRFLENHKHLGIHTDCFNGAHIALIKKGAADNSKKEYMRGVSVGGYFRASPDELRFLDKNPAVMMKKLSWVCAPEVLGKISGLMSVNTGAAIDFRGQVCAASPKTGFAGSAGAMLDFARGAKRSAGGKFFVVMRSSVLDRNGVRTSAILPALPAGAPVSIPRSELMYVVTEYGAADLRDMSVKERVRALIALAHPDYREMLSGEAKKHGFV